MCSRATGVYTKNHDVNVDITLLIKYHTPLLVFPFYIATGLLFISALHESRLAEMLLVLFLLLLSY